MDWKTIGAFGAVIAAIVTISSNALGHKIKMRRERRIVLRKALFHLLEIRGIVQVAYNAREMKDRIKPNNVGAIGLAVHYWLLQTFDAVVYDGTLVKRQSLYGKFNDIVQSIGGEDPFLALQIASCDRFLHQLDVIQQRWSEQQERSSTEKPSDIKEGLLMKITSQRVPDLPEVSSIASVLKSLDKSIDRLGSLCGRKLHKMCKEYLKKNHQPVSLDHSGKSTLPGKDILEKLKAQSEFVQEFGAKDL